MHSIFYYEETLMKELGHEDRVLDYLKVDTDKPGGTGFEDVVRVTSNFISDLMYIFLLKLEHYIEIFEFHEDCVTSI